MLIINKALCARVTIGSHWMSTHLGEEQVSVPSFLIVYGLIIIACTYPYL